jgi:hypothetical protein
VSASSLPVDGRISLGGIRRAVSRLAVVWPVLACAILLAAFTGVQIMQNHGDPAALVQFGSARAAWSRPPAGAPLVHGIGYDGQYYWLQATDPLLLARSTITRLHHVAPAYRLQRFAYPALAWLLAGGRRDLLAWSMYAINILAALGLTLAFALVCRRRGWNPAWAFVIGLAPGILISVSRDLSDVLAVACLVGGLLAWEGDRPRLAGALLAVAALSREPMLLGAAAVGIELAARCRKAGDRETIRRLLRRGAPAVLAPVGAYAAWQLYLRSRPGRIPGGADHPTFPPFRDFVDAGAAAVRTGSAGHMVFVLGYLLLTLGGIAVSLWLLRRGRGAMLLMAALYGVLVLPLAFLSDGLALTRYTAPLFFCLLIAGLQHRCRPALSIAAGASAMTLLLPLLAY